MDLVSLLDLFVFALFTCRGPFSNSENMVPVIVFFFFFFFYSIKRKVKNFSIKK